MDLIIKKISQFEYQKLNYPILFSDEKTDRCFAEISKNDISYKFGWQSDKIEPFLFKIDEFKFALGIDQNFVIIDFNIKKIVFKLTLDYFFYKCKIYKNSIYIITELEVIQVNISNYKIVRNIYLPNYYQSIKFADETAIVYCFDDEIIKIDLK